jgi:hypothetical protein
LIAGLIAGITILFLPRQNKTYRFWGIAFVGFTFAFIVLRISSDWILTNWGLGVPYWGDAAFTEEILLKIAEGQREIRMTVHSAMWNQRDL